MKLPFQNWTYKKHFKFVTTVHAVCYIADMTIAFYIIKKYLDKSEKAYDADAMDYDLEFED